MKLSVIIPVYNEDATIVELLRRVHAVPVEKEIIVVDDGSQNSVAPHIQAANIPELRFFQHAINQGKGAAIRTGLSHVTGDVVIIQDADFEYFPEDYIDLMRVYQEKGAQAVYGVRDLSHRTRIMRWGNYFVTWVANLLYGSKLADMETCYKLIDAQLIQSLQLESSRFEIEAEISAKLLRAHVKIVETPIRYQHRKEGKKLTPLDGFPTVLWLLKCRFWQP
ncbi:MAG: glycosyltransferase family 2 protein [Anaerolineales bacterium]|nr:glycosyltransferase family 2 protein [Anaerolineales bacterium]MCB8952293.1 glycosyltransferase family 2 protein [Ardenticatenales bacterium]